MQYTAWTNQNPIRTQTYLLMVFGYIMQQLNNK